jgi:endoglucanase
VVFGSANYNNIDYLKFLKIPKEDRNIIVTFHYYEPYQFTHQGVSWEKDSNDWLGKKWTGSDAEKQAVVKEFDIAADWAKQNNRPVNLGEFGVHKNADMDSRVRWTKFVTDTAVERGFSIHYWEFCAAEFGLYDQQTKSFRKPLLEAVVPPKK